MEHLGSRWLRLLPLLGLCLLALAVLPFIGLRILTPAEVWLQAGGPASDIFWKLRLPRVLAGMLAGASLAAGGLAFQALFRNPLATPFTLGTASGASLGASLYIGSGCSFALLGVSGVTLSAFLGASAALALVYGLTRVRRAMATETMLLAGVAVGIFFSSLILLLQYLSNQAHSLRILRWLMGGLDVIGYQSLLQALPMVLPGLILICLLRYDLNLLTGGQELAASRGMNVDRVKLLLLLAVGLMIGAVVSVAGPIGFVGLMVPHVCRRWYGPDHRILLPATLLLGAAFLPACDAAARLLLAPAELPVGIITAILGGPFFVWILIQREPRR